MQCIWILTWKFILSLEFKIAWSVLKIESGWPIEFDLNKFPDGIISELTLSHINEVCSNNIEENSNNDIDPELDFDEMLFEVHTS